MNCCCGNQNCAIPHGFCHCGCGRKTNIVTQNQTAGKLIKGQPFKYAYGHSPKKGPIKKNPITNPIIVDGVSCRYILLTQGQIAIVDDDMYEKLNKYKWNAIYNEGMKVYYAVRKPRKEENRNVSRIWMHREVLNEKEYNRKIKVDHKDSSKTLDNRRTNLRLASSSQNTANSKLNKDSRSGLKGVTWHTRSRKWIARIRVNGTLYQLGSFDDKFEAHESYKKAAIKYFGEFARFE